MRPCPKGHCKVSSQSVSFQLSGFKARIPQRDFGHICRVVRKAPPTLYLQSIGSKGRFAISTSRVAPFTLGTVPPMSRRNMFGDTLPPRRSSGFNRPDKRRWISGRRRNVDGGWLVSRCRSSGSWFATDRSAFTDPILLVLTCFRRSVFSNSFFPSAPRRSASIARLAILSLSSGSRPSPNELFNFLSSLRSFSRS